MKPLVAALCLLASVSTGLADPIRVLFLGHESEHHPSDLYFPMLSKALGPDAIYFDYVQTPEEAFDNAEWLSHFDAILLYANHDTITPKQWKNLKAFVEDGGGFLPIHCASWCFQNQPQFDQLVGGRFASHKTKTFTTRIIAPDHPAMADVIEFEAWDETYKHKNHNPNDRTVLMVRQPEGEDENITEPEPWTWVRTQGKGRVFYTASGHDERVWAQPAFHQLIKSGILWSVGDGRRATYEKFISQRTPLTYEKNRGNIPNYEKRPDGPLDYQLPLSAEDSLDYTRAPAGFRLELFASEPDIINPIAMAWDESGRLWVAETTDYPNEVRTEGGNDKIKILEDTTGDGKCDKVTIFADGLNIPTSLTHHNGGIIVAMAPNFLFLKDTDGDDKADIKEVINTGWGINDTHAGPSSLRYGFDNHIYGAIGYSGYNKDGNRFGSGLFKMQPDGTELTFLHQFNNNTWGIDFNADGDIFGSTANNNPSFYGGLPATAYADGKKGISAKMIADSRSFHPITPNIRQVDAFGAYTAGCGHVFATSANFPESWRDNSAFVCGPTGGLVGRFDIQNNESGYVAKNQGSVVASADEWFSPVATEIGPDGNLWIADWYNFIIQHNPAPTIDRAGYEGKKGLGNAHENPNRDKQHGRIYRLIWESGKKSDIPTLANSTSKEKIAALSSDNQFWRLTAQRLLVESGDKSTAPQLRELTQSNGVAAIHALWALKGLGELDKDTHQRALLSKQSALKRNAIRALGNDEQALGLFFDTAVVASPDSQVRLAAFTKLSEFPKSETIKLATTQLSRNQSNRKDEWLALALKAAGGRHGATGAIKLGPNLLPNPSFEKIDPETNLPEGWTIRNYRGKSRHLVTQNAPRTGKNSLQIYSSTEDGGSDTSLFTHVKVKPNTDYRLSGWIRTRGLTGAAGALLNAHEIGKEGATNSLVKNNADWVEVLSFFNSGDRTEFTINCLFGGWGTSTGTAFYDDVALQEVTEIDESDAASKLTGNVSRGKEIFMKHEIAACIRCHMIEGQGGPIGPALDGIATRKSEDYIHESLIDPGATIAEGFQAEVSPMPPMGILLQPQEFADIMAYLMTLKE